MENTELNSKGMENPDEQEAKNDTASSHEEIKASEGTPDSMNEETTSKSVEDEQTSSSIDEPVIDESTSSSIKESEIVEPASLSIEPEATNEKASESEQGNSDESEPEEDPEPEEIEEREEHSNDEEQDFSGFSREELLAYVKSAAAKPQGKNIGRKVQHVKSEFNRIYREHVEELRASWANEEHEEEEDFTPEPDPMYPEFNTAFKEFKKNRQAYINDLNREKEENLEKKKEVLEKLKLLTESDETGESFEEFKRLQQEWRSIRHVPMNEAENLWNTYHFYIDKFYEHRSLYSEFKELDRKRNLATKEEVVNKIESLVESEDLGEALKQLKQLQEEWRHIGPVPREQVEDVIVRYKAAVLKLYERKEKQSVELQQRREQNYQAKLEILEKIESITSIETTKVQEWIDKNKELGEWIEKWREIGSVPLNHSQDLKDKFTGAIRNFNKNKNDFFRNRKKDKVDSLKKKNALCERAEEILKEENPAQFRKEVIKLQEEWKKTGPVPQKYSDKIWKRFQAACDAIFTNINQESRQRSAGERENLEKKNAIMSRLEELIASEKIEDPLKIVKEIQTEWNAIGFVPFKEKDNVRKKYSDLYNKFIHKTRGNLPAGFDGEEMNYEQIAQGPGGARRLDQEVQRHTRDIKRIESEISTLENNMEFFSRSKNADKLKDNIEKQISKLREKMSEIQNKISAIRQVKS